MRALRVWSGLLFVVAAGCLVAAATTDGATRSVASFFALVAVVLAALLGITARRLG